MKTCAQGHQLSFDNTVVRGGRIRCITCQRGYNEVSARRKKAKKLISLNSDAIWPYSIGHDAP